MSDDPTKRTRKYQKTPKGQATRKPKVTPARNQKRDFSQVALAVVEKAAGINALKPIKSR